MVIILECSAIHGYAIKDRYIIQGYRWSFESINLYINFIKAKCEQVNGALLNG